MTHLEQDKELREKINSLFESVFSQGVRAGKDVATETYEDFDAWFKKGELDEAMKLISAERKRVALEARKDISKLYEKELDMHRKFMDSVIASNQLKTTVMYCNKCGTELEAQLKAQ